MNFAANHQIGALLALILAEAASESDVNFVYTLLRVPDQCLENSGVASCETGTSKTNDNLNGPGIS
jgi:hypothetical protein